MDKARIVIAVGIGRSMIVVATDSAWVREDAIEMRGDADDMGILQGKDRIQEPGLYLWDGTVKQVVTQTSDGYELDGIAYTGTLKPIHLHEMAKLLSMTPPHWLVEVEQK